VHVRAIEREMERDKMTDNIVELSARRHRSDQAAWDRLLSDVTKLMLATPLINNRRVTAALGAIIAILQLEDDLTIGEAKVLIATKLELFYDQPK
jgi:hypothetical protein